MARRTTVAEVAARVRLALKANGAVASTELALVVVQTPSMDRDRADLHREVLVDAFFEVLAKVEAAFADEITQEPKPHREKLRVELAASLQTLQAILNLSGLRMAERLSAMD